MRPWAAMEHAPACGNYDGAALPVAATGKCVASAPTGVAAKRLGPDPALPGRFYIPDGHFVQPAGHDQVLHGEGILSAFVSDVLLVPGTRFAVALDAGVRDNALYSVDLDAVAADKPGLISSLKAAGQLDVGLAFVAPNRVLASGGADGKVYSYAIDLASGVLARDPAGDLSLGKSATGRNAWYAGGLATSADGKTLVVASSTAEGQARVIDLTSKVQTAIDLQGSLEIFGVTRDPYDPGGAGYWIASLDGRALLRVDASSAAITSRLPTGSNPEGLAFLGGKHLAAVFSGDDAIGLYDLPTNKPVQTLAVGSGASGAQPGTMSYDDTLKRLYVTLSGENAIGVYAYDAEAAAPLSPLGKIPTSWFPTAVRVRPDGSLVVVTAKGHSSGPTLTENVPETMFGTIAVIAPPQPGDLAAMTATVEASRRSTAAEGFPQVSCGGGADDFPVPATNTGAPSSRIEHVVYVIRENKTFDSVFGDLPGVDGDPALVMSPGKMDDYWRNARAIARTFTNFDNYAISAEQSLQGHVWTSFGRSTDYIERTWSSAWGRGVRTPKAGLDRTFGSPVEGGLFLWAERNHVSYDDMGEIIGAGNQGFDLRYPGIVYSQTVPDQEKACYLAARARALCDLKAISYVIMPNDHTLGNAPGAPTSELMISMNDVATGLLLDALSHSPAWPTTLLIVTEDDPQDGYDHVDGHRTPLFMASPWVKRGYVSHSRIDSAAIHKLFAHLFAKPYNNARAAEAAVPFDAFTSTPDFTPYTYAPLTTKVSCNAASSKSYAPPNADPGALYDVPDQAPWLRREVGEHMRTLGTAPR